MTQTVTLQVPNKLASTAQAVAKQTKRPVEEILVEWLNNAIEHLPMESFDDQQIIALTQLTIEPSQQTELSDLLAKNREMQLSGTEKERLNELMRFYRQSLVQKAEAMKLAVERGLLPPLT
jgi:hypothetical protein